MGAANRRTRIPVYFLDGEVTIVPAYDIHGDIMTVDWDHLTQEKTSL